MLARFFWFAPFLVLVVLAGCGGSDPEPIPNTVTPATNNPSPSVQASPAGGNSTAPANAAGGVLQDACTLLTKAEVEAALAASVGEVLSSLPGTQFPACEFSAPGSRAQIVVHLVVNPFFNNNAARGAFDALKPPNAVNVSGLGDTAYWNGEVGRIVFLKGRHMVSLDVRQPGSKDRQTVARELAGKAAPRVP